MMKCTRQSGCGFTNDDQLVHYSALTDFVIDPPFFIYTCQKTSDCIRRFHDINEVKSFIPHK